MEFEKLFKEKLNNDNLLNVLITSGFNSETLFKTVKNLQVFMDLKTLNEDTKINFLNFIFTKDNSKKFNKNIINNITDPKKINKNIINNINEEAKEYIYIFSDIIDSIIKYPDYNEILFNTKVNKILTFLFLLLAKDTKDINEYIEKYKKNNVLIKKYNLQINDTNLISSTVNNLNIFLNDGILVSLEVRKNILKYFFSINEKNNNLVNVEIFNQFINIYKQIKVINFINKDKNNGKFNIGTFEDDNNFLVLVENLHIFFFNKIKNIINHPILLKINELKNINHDNYSSFFELIESLLKSNNIKNYFSIETTINEIFYKNITNNNDKQNIFIILDTLFTNYKFNKLKEIHYNIREKIFSSEKIKGGTIKIKINKYI
jgi:hypothetical protein